MSFKELLSEKCECDNFCWLNADGWCTGNVYCIYKEDPIANQVEELEKQKKRREAFSNLIKGGAINIPENTYNKEVFVEPNK